MNKLSAPSFSIQDLCEKTGLPRRTIHFYTQQGLIPPPEGAGPGTRYSELHLLKLRSIPRLRQEGLRLDQIRVKLAQLTMEELQSILSAEPAPTASSPSQPPQLFVHFAFPAGITIHAPQRLTASDKGKLDQLLSCANRIFRVDQPESEQEE